MTKSKPRVFLSPNARNDFRRLPGNIRRQLISEIDRLERTPRPSNSKRLKVENESREVRRLRTGQWRIIYWMKENRPVIIGIRKRPPYDYEDIQELLKGI